LKFTSAFWAEFCVSTDGQSALRTIFRFHKI
jgi:hypothetical protein